MNPTRRRLVASMPGLLLASTPRLGGAQAHRHTARLLCGYPPGGALDAVCRTLAVGMTGSYARTVVVENNEARGLARRGGQVCGCGEHAQVDERGFTEVISLTVVNTQLD